MDYELAGSQFNESLASFAPAKRKRGRPTKLGNEALARRCENLLGFFEYDWAGVAWHLARVRSLPKLREALQRGVKEGQHNLELFLHEKLKVGSVQELKDACQELSKAQAQFRSALDDQSETDRKFKQAKSALHTNPEHPRLPELYQKAERNWRYLSQQIETLRLRVERLSDEVQRRKAHFAQSQLLEFLGSSKRYKLNPLNLCKAMAGVPEMSWRQSAARLSKLKIKHPFEAEYAAFCVVKRAIGTAPKTAEKAKDRVKRFLVAGPKRSHVFKQLRRNFYFLQVGLDNAYASSVPKSAINFLAFETYQIQRRAPQSGDELMADEEQL